VRHPRRALQMDVSNTVDVTDHAAVAGVIRTMLEQRYPGFDFAAIDTLAEDFARLYAGTFPGFRACDIKYHDAQHVLDVTLAMARLLDGHDSSEGPDERLGPELALAGIAAAFFHDSGYIRRTRDSRHKNGAAYTRVHVSRSARFMQGYLPQVGLEALAGVCSRVVHFTGYELDTRHIEVANDAERRLGMLLGTADLIAQMADVDYLRKCREHLYEEFEAGGLAGERGHSSHTGTIYRSPDHLLESTVDFIRTAIDVRLKGQFASVYRYAARHFGGEDLYMDAIEDNCRRLESSLSANSREFAPALQF
jgi:hypothetical protein